MKYVFYPKESYILDALLFPGMIYYDEHKIMKGDENFFELIPSSSLSIMKKIHELVLPYEEGLRTFYFKGAEERDFIELLMVNNPFMGQEDPLAYLDLLMGKSEEALLSDVLFAMDFLDQDTGETDKEASRERVRKLMEEPEQIMPWLNNLSMGNDAKWNLYAFTQKPKKTLEEYRRLMAEILPKFEEFYKAYGKKVQDYGEDFVSRLEAMEGDGLSEISNGIVKEKVLNRAQADVLVSLVNAFSIMLHVANVKPFIAWGYDIEKIFKAIKEKEDNQLQERVTIFKNLGDRTRYEVLMNISKGITSTKVIAKNLSVSSATISYHLNNLVTAKLIYLDQLDGKYTYKVNEELMEKSIEGLRADLSMEKAEE